MAAIVNLYLALSSNMFNHKFLQPLILISKVGSTLLQIEILTRRKYQPHPRSLIIQRAQNHNLVSGY